MYIIVAGAGVVGLHIASTLAEGKHEVTVIDPSDAVIEAVRNQLDVRTLVGNAGAPRILREAEVGRADLIVAVTHSDETNMLICFLAKELGAGMTVSRVRNPEYSGFFVTAAKSPSAARKIIRPKSLGVDLYISPEVEVADEIVDVLCGYCSIPVSNFAGGRVQIGEFKVDRENVVNRPLKDIDFPEPCIAAAIVRGGKTIIPGSEEILLRDDHIFLVGARDSMDILGGMVAEPQPPVGNVVIFGGGRVGYLVADRLERQAISVKVIERSPEVSQQIAADLRSALVVQGDATDRDFLIEQGVSSADAFVSTTDSDELNILCALLAKHLGVRRSVVALTRPGYIPLAEAIGVDVTVSSLLLTASRIAHFVLHGGAISASFIGGEDLQAIEFVVSPGAGVANKNLTEAGLPKEAIAGAVIHNEDIIIPPNDTVIYPGDHVIVISPLSAITSVERLFK
jgi:trk system potassium uptake protein TrkA